MAHRKCGSGAETIRLLIPAFYLLADKKDEGKKENIRIEAARQNVLMKDATQKTPHKNAAFSHIYRNFLTKKVAKTGNFEKRVTLNEKRHFKDAASRFYGQK